jgi:hypothetical protein
MREHGTVTGHAHKARKRKAKTRTGKSPVTTILFDPRAYAIALTMAQGERHRVHPARDGSGAVYVTNGGLPGWI